MRYLELVFASGLLASCGWQAAEAGRVSFDTMRLQCKSYAGDLFHRFADIDYVTLGPSRLEMSIGPIGTSDSAWVFENTDKYKKIGDLDRFYAQGVSGNGVIGAGIRAGTPFSFRLSQNERPRHNYEFRISTIEDIAAYDIVFICNQI